MPNVSQNGAKKTQQGNVPFLGGNIDGIPIGNRSPPRNSNSSQGSNNGSP